MSAKIWKSAAVLAAAPLALVLAGCATNESSSESGTGADATADTATLSGTFNGAGASSQETAEAAWISGFQAANNNVTVNYNPVGSGAGREQFIQGAAVFAGSDSYLSDEELAGSFGACATGSSAIDLPVYISPIAVAFNVEGVESLNLDATTLAQIFSGKITNWNDEAIAALNPDVELPDLAITVVHRSDDSGTTENFTEYLYDNVPDVWENEPSETFPYSFEGAQGTSGVVDAIKNGVGTIGYADASKVGDLSTASIKVGENFVALSSEAAAAVVDASPQVEGRAANDLAIDLDRTTTADGTYPLVLVSYLIVCESYADSTDAQFVKEYVSYVASEEGQQTAAEGAGSAPISDATRESILTAVEAIS